jgi:hypothetical protein
MYSKKFVALLAVISAVMVGAVAVIANQEVQSYKAYLAYANSRSEVYRVDLAKAQQKIDDLETDKFVDKMEEEGNIQKERIKTHEANERHRYTLTQIKDAATAGMTAAQLEGWILRNETPEERSPKEQLKELVEKLQKLTR